MLHHINYVGDGLWYWSRQRRRPTDRPLSLRRTAPFPSRISGSGIKLPSTCEESKNVYHFRQPKSHSKSPNLSFLPTHYVAPSHNEPMHMFPRRAEFAAGKISYEGREGAMDRRQARARPSSLPSAVNTAGCRGANDLLTFLPACLISSASPCTVAPIYRLL